MCSAGKCSCNRCGTHGSGDIEAALLRAHEKMLAKRARMAELAASREKHVPSPGANP